ncbi:putative F-box domain-containing protein [Helianthus annuus]|nr:putative F-box domain-containing protein [Helianthus annuus]
MKMETQEEEQSTTTDAQLAKKVNPVLPSEIIEEILSRLPVKSILRFTSVSKPWLSYISDQSFTQLHRTRATTLRRIAFFLSAFDSSTRKNYFFSAADDGEPLTLLMTLDGGYITEAQHLNGLVCFSFIYFSYPRFQADAFVLNPSTHKFFKLPCPYSLMNYAKETCYYFGFDESRNEHKILMIRLRDLRARTAEIMIYSMSNYSWRTIDVEPPVGFTWDRLGDRLGNSTKASVCVNSVVYIGVDRHRNSFDILGFDLRREKFSMISTPEGVVVRGFYRPRIIEINGSIGVVCYNYMKKSNEMYFWILQNGVWVREIITFPESWVELAGPALEPLDVNMDDIIFYKSKVSGSVMSMPIYDKRFSRCFKSMQFNLGHQFPCSKTVRLNQIKFYAESMVSVTNTTDSSPQAPLVTSAWSIRRKRTPARRVTSTRPIRTKRTPACFTEWGSKYFTESTLKRKCGGFGVSTYPQGKIRQMIHP